MPPTTEDRLLDVLESIADIDDLLAGQDLKQFLTDRARRAATERYLEIICEAARHIPDQIKADAPHIDWHGMTDFGNLLRHAYHTTKPDKVWDIIHNHLPPLKAFVESRIRK